MAYDFGFFTDGGCCPTNFVISQKKCKKEDVLEIFKSEVTAEGYEVEDLVCDEVYEAYIRYYPKTPEDMQHDYGDWGLWMFCNKGRGALPVYVIDMYERVEE